MDVLLTGATGFVGRHLHPALVEAGHRVICISRHARSARAREPEKIWRQCDVSSSDQLRSAMEGCRAAYYLVHSLSSDPAYPEKEARLAETFARMAAEAGLERVVYLGGVAPRGRPSQHLASRLRCGEILREGQVPAFELRASMIIGRGSASWNMVRDLAQRLPAMVLPLWMTNHSWPVSVRDVVRALVEVLDLPVELAGHYDMPGTDRLSHQQLLLMIADQMGKHPPHVRVPFVSPRLSSYWVGWVSDVPVDLVRELVAGLSSDLDPKPPTIWSLLPPHDRLTTEQSIQLTLQEEAGLPSSGGSAWWRSVRRVAQTLRPGAR